MIININGQLMTVGMCDDLRPMTLIGLPTNEYQIYINGQDILDYLSEVNDMKRE